MLLDRRRTPRPGMDRRQCDRVPDYRMVEWKPLETMEKKKGTLVQWSRSGVAILAEAEDTPGQGEQLLPRRRPDAQGWRHPVQVRRIAHLPGGMNLIIADYCDAGRRTRDLAAEALHDLVRPPEGNGRLSHERRRSPRWPTDKVLNWRLHRGKRTRRSRLVLRSLDGFVLVADPHDTPCKGDRMRPATDEDRRRFGFHSALIKRVDRTHPDASLVYAEIEA